MTIPTSYFAKIGHCNCRKSPFRFLLFCYIADRYPQEAVLDKVSQIISKDQKISFLNVSSIDDFPKCKANVDQYLIHTSQQGLLLMVFTATIAHYRAWVLALSLSLFFTFKSVIFRSFGKCLLGSSQHYCENLGSNTFNFYTFKKHTSESV